MLRLLTQQEFLMQSSFPFAVLSLLLASTSHAQGDIDWDDEFVQDCSTGGGRCLSQPDSECWDVRADTNGVLSFTKLGDNKTKSCQTMLDIFPCKRLRVNLVYNPCATMNDTTRLNVPRFNIFRVDSENENFPLRHALQLTVQNGTKFEVEGSAIILDYYHSGDSDLGLGLTYVLQYEGLHCSDPAHTPTTNHIIQQPQRSLTSEDYSFSRSRPFTTWLLRGPIYQNRMPSYLKNIVLGSLKLGTNCASCLLTFTTMSESVNTFTGYGNLLSFYTSSRYPITVNTDAFGPVLVTLKLRNDTINTDPHFSITWSYLG